MNYNKFVARNAATGPYWTDHSNFSATHPSLATPITTGQFGAISSIWPVMYGTPIMETVEIMSINVAHKIAALKTAGPGLDFIRGVIEHRMTSGYGDYVKSTQELGAIKAAIESL